MEMSGMAKPRVGDMARLRRAALYLRGAPICDCFFHFFLRKTKIKNNVGFFVKKTL